MVTRCSNVVTETNDENEKKNNPGVLHERQANLTSRQSVANSLPGSICIYIK